LFSIFIFLNIYWEKKTRITVKRAKAFQLFILLQTSMKQERGIVEVTQLWQPGNPPLVLLLLDSSFPLTKIMQPASGTDVDTSAIQGVNFY